MMKRRTFLSTLAAMAVTAIAALLALPAAAYVLSPLRRREEGAGWIDLGAAGSLPEGAPVLVRYQVEIADGWAKRARPASAWVTRRGQGFQVFTSVCPHLGCAFRWARGADRFQCPCHASAFAPDGRRLEGPSPRDLDPLPWKAEGGKLLVQHVAYRSGVAGRVPA